MRWRERIFLALSSLKNSVKNIKYSFHKTLFLFLCHRLGIKVTHEEIFYLWRLHALKLWNKIAYEIAFYPHWKLSPHILVLGKYATKPITTNEIGPGSEFLSWFQALHSKEQTNDCIELTKKQRSFVFALSCKLGTSPSVVFQCFKHLEWLMHGLR